MNKNKSIIVGIFIFLIVIIVSILVVVMSTKTVENKDETKVSKSSLYEVDHYDNTYVYVDTDGKIVTMEEYEYVTNLESGSSLARKNGEDDYSIIDNKGNVIVPSDKYDSIDDTLGMFDSLTLNLNYVAEKQDKYALLDVEGKELTDFKYDNISSWMFNNYIYKIEVDEKYGVIANTRKSFARA